MAASESGLHDPLLNGKSVKRDIGNISEMTLFRWSRDLGFPEPDVVIGGRRFWRRSSVQRWVETQKTESVAPEKQAALNRARASRFGGARASRSDAVVVEPSAVVAAPE